MASLRLILMWRHLMPKIYESPDKGKTVYQREMGDPHAKRELIMEPDTYTIDCSQNNVTTLDEGLLTIGTTVTNIGDYTFELEDPEKTHAAGKLPLGLQKKYGLKD